MTSSLAPALCAVVGNPIEHSRSPAIHQQFAEQTGIALRYDRILSPLDGFARTVREFFDAGGRGLNVTVPFKLEAWELARTHLSQRATLAQAVNTLWTDRAHCMVAIQMGSDLCKTYNDSLRLILTHASC